MANSASNGRKRRQNGDVIFRASITTKDGRVIKASDYGLRAFPIPVGRNRKS